MLAEERKEIFSHCSFTRVSWYAMPPRNYAREALIQHCIDVSCDDEHAKALLHRVVTENRDFLVPFACSSQRAPPTDEPPTSHSHHRQPPQTATWFHSYTTDTTRKHLSYHQLLARAFLYTKHLTLPEQVWLRPGFEETFRAEARRVIQSRVPILYHNLDVVRADPVAGQIVTSIEESYPGDAMRFLYLYNRLIDTIHNGIPPKHVVERLMGTDCATEYQAMLDDVEQLRDVSVDYALEQGHHRQTRGHAHWQQRDIAKSLSRLRLLCDHHHMSRFEVGELYEQLCQRETDAFNTHRRSKLDKARALGAWRIRPKDHDLWRQALSDCEWEAYQQCDKALRTTMERGVYSLIPRRHFCASSVRTMQATNLPRLCERLNVPLPEEN